MGGSGSTAQRSSARSARRRAAPAAKTSVEIEVPFHDVDSLGIVWHGHYYKYLEIARTALLRACRVDARDLRELGFGLVMIESRCRHVAPLRYGDVARVSAWLRDVRHRLRVEYEIALVSDGTQVARAETTLVTVTRAGELLLETPEALRTRLEPVLVPADAGGAAKR
jgi:acyl-CoA thioester hydrolase